MTIRTAATQSVVRCQVVMIFPDLHVGVIQSCHQKCGTTTTNYLQHTNKLCYGCNMPPPKAWYDLHKLLAKQKIVVVTCRHPKRDTTYTKC